jgi:hypothetical protein
MKSRIWLPLLAVVMMAGPAVSFADVSVRFAVGNRWGSRPWYGYGHRRYPRGYYSPVVIAPSPVYVAQPYYVPAPAYYAPVPVVQPVAPPSTGDYGDDLANLHEKMSRLRNLLERQIQKGGIPQDQYNRYMDTLDGISHDERVKAFDRGGNLNPDDFADLYRRLDQVSEDIEIALAQ